MDDSLSWWELIWKFIPIKPNWYIIHNADYEDKYSFSFFLIIKKFKRV